MKFLWPLLAMFALSTGCDSFSVIDQFRLEANVSNSLVLAAQNPTLQQNETTLLVPSGGVPPYTYAILADDITSTGSPDLGAVNGATPEYTAGTSIGTRKIRVIDGPGATADCIVTVLPPAPTIVSVTPSTSPNQETITWTYPNLAFITGYVLWYSNNSGATYTQLATPLKAATSYTQNGAQTNYYRLYAVSGAYQSLAAEAH